MPGPRFKRKLLRKKANVRHNKAVNALKEALKHLRFERKLRTKARRVASKGMG